MHALRVNFVASEVPAGGLENALPLSGWLANDGTSCRCRVLWRGSKQERHPQIRNARHGVHSRSRRSTAFIIRIDPHKGSHTAAVIDGDERVVGMFALRAMRTECPRRRVLATGAWPRRRVSRWKYRSRTCIL